MFRGNPNKDYKKNIQFTGGRISDYSPSSNPNLSVYKTANGTRGVVHQGEIYYDDGNGKFKSTHGPNFLSYDMPKKEEPKPESSGDGGGGGGGGGGSSGGNSGDRTPSYGTTNPQAGNTGSRELDGTTQALMDMVKSLTESLTASWDTKAAAEDVSKNVSKPAGEGLASTVLTGGSGYIPPERKKKKSFLTPISVG